MNALERRKFGAEMHHSKSLLSSVEIAHLAGAQHPCFLGRNVRLSFLNDAFIKQGGGCRATYYNHAKRLRQPLEIPEIRLPNRPPERKLADARLLDLLRRRFGILGNDEPL